MGKLAKVISMVPDQLQPPVSVETQTTIHRLHRPPTYPQELKDLEHSAWRFCLAAVFTFSQMETAVPEISFFYGIHIRLNFRDHSPPHVHVVYGEYEAQVRIADGEIEAGYLPRRAARLVNEWMGLHRDEVMDAWNLAQALCVPPKIEPLP